MRLCVYSFANIIIEQSVLFIGFLNLGVPGHFVNIWSRTGEKLLTSTGKPERRFNFDGEDLFPDLRAAKFC
jgi:hypothetical protein